MGVEVIVEVAAAAASLLHIVVQDCTILWTCASNSITNVLSIVRAVVYTPVNERKGVDLKRKCFYENLIDQSERE